MKQPGRQTSGLVPVRCRVLSKETEDHYKKVKDGDGPKVDKPFRTIRIEKECQLVPASMLKERKRSMAQQIAIVKREIERLRDECPECFDELDQEEQDRLIEIVLNSLEEKKKQKPNPCGVPGNPYHDEETGRFSSPEDGNYCKSLWFSCRQQGRRRGTKGSKSTKWIKSPANAGRHTKSEPRKVKCSTGKPIKEEEKNGASARKIRIRIG